VPFRWCRRTSKLKLQQATPGYWTLELLEVYAVYIASCSCSEEVPTQSEELAHNACNIAKTAPKHHTQF